MGINFYLSYVKPSVFSNTIYAIPCRVNMRAPDIIAQLIWPPHLYDIRFSSQILSQLRARRALVTHIFLLFCWAHTSN